MSRTDLVQRTECSKLYRHVNLSRPRLVAKETPLTARAGVWKRKREDLKNRRTSLFRRYEKTPYDLRLAVEIKIIDDRIAECTQQIERENQRLEPVGVILS
jgi:hypothetical protein